MNIQIYCGKKIEGAEFEALKKDYDAVLIAIGAQKVMKMGLPGEDRDMILETIDYINRLPVQGIKMSMLHILKNTPLGAEYQKNPFLL